MSEGSLASAQFSNNKIHRGVRAKKKVQVYISKEALRPFSP